MLVAGCYNNAVRACCVALQPTLTLHPLALARALLSGGWPAVLVDTQPSTVLFTANVPLVVSSINASVGRLPMVGCQSQQYANIDTGV